MDARIAKRTHSQLKSIGTSVAEIKASNEKILAHITELERNEHPEATDFIERHGADEIVKVSATSISSRPIWRGTYEQYLERRTPGPIGFAASREGHRDNEGDASAGLR